MMFIPYFSMPYFDGNIQSFSNKEFLFAMQRLINAIFISNHKSRKELNFMIFPQNTSNRVKLQSDGTVKLSNSHLTLTPVYKRSKSGIM